MAVIDVTYLTDLACPCSWAATGPPPRGLEVDFAGARSFTYVMYGSSFDPAAGALRLAAG